MLLALMFLHVYVHCSDFVFDVVVYLYHCSYLCSPFSLSLCFSLGKSLYYLSVAVLNFIFLVAV